LKHRNSENLRRLGEGTFLNRRITDFISQLTQRKDDALANLNYQEKYLAHVRGLESQRNQQLKDHD
jgi:hypothetical protein